MIQDRKIGIIIQARMGSTRLPGKVVMPIGGEPLILHLYNRIHKHFKLPIIIATTDNPKDDELVNLLIGKGVRIHRGSEYNVVGRFIDAANFIGLTDVIRVCSDNPLLDFDFLDRLIDLWHNDRETDYISFEFEQKPVILSHFGVFAEIVKLSALKEVAIRFPDNKIYMEHVTNGIYLNQDIFKIRLLNLDKELRPYNGIRLTIDTAEDFIRVSELIANSKAIQFKNIASYLLSQPVLLSDMKNTIIQNSK